MGAPELILLAFHGLGVFGAFRRSQSDQSEEAKSALYLTIIGFSITQILLILGDFYA